MARAMGARRRAMTQASKLRKGCGRPIIAGSLNRLRRKGCTASGRSGPPRLNSTTAMRRRPDASTTPVPHLLDECGNMLRRCCRHDAMTQVENERTLAEHCQDALGLAAHRLAADHK